MKRKRHLEDILVHSLVWFRGKDLRVSDHEPLRSALAQGPCTLVFVLDPYFFAPSRAQRMPHRLQFLLESLAALERNIESRGGKLYMLRGHSVRVIPDAARRLKVDRVVAYRWTEPVGQRRDARVAEALDVPLELLEGETLLPPGAVLNQQGHPYSVFTPFGRAVRAQLSVPEPLPAPRRLVTSGGSTKKLTSLLSDLPKLQELGLTHNPGILKGGEAAARKRLKDFCSSSIQEYRSERDKLPEDGTSRLSADLKFGTVSVRTGWRAASACPASEGRETFLNQLLWREFAYTTLWHRPELLERPFRKAFEQFDYEGSEEHFQAWKEGRTGIPVVDASAHQLLREGYVHNRARMISASFLTKNLRIDYRRGEAHYLKYLTDGDWALNNMGWQWASGCGVDAAPYFRVFNPVLQGKKFDPQGDYVRRYLSALENVPPRLVHTPREVRAPIAEIGSDAPLDYPTPIVDLKATRLRYLELAQECLS